MKKFLYLLLFLALTSPILSVGAADDTACDAKSGFDLYSCRVKNICEVYNKKKPVYTTEKYEDAKNFSGAGGINLTAFTNAQSLYKKNISSIYKCSIIEAQKKSLKKVKDILLKIEKSGALEDKVGKELETKIQKLDISSSAVGCRDSSDTDVYMKLNVLNEATYEMCKYVNYLEYLKIFYKDISHVVEDSQGQTQTAQNGYPFDYIGAQMSSIQQKIDSEEGHTYKVAGTVFNAYTEYENNLPVHLFLQLIREDFIIIRDKLYQAINPINQVVYKISNAMKK